MKKILIPGLLILAIVVAVTINASYVQGNIGKINQNMPRGQFVSLVVRNILPTTDFSYLKSYKNCFPDLKGSGYENYICYANAWSYFNWYKKLNFEPNSPITRADAARILMQTDALSVSGKKGWAVCNEPDENYYTDLKLYDSAQPNAAIKMITCFGVPGIVKGGQFKPNDFLTFDEWKIWYKNIMAAEDSYMTYDNQFTAYNEKGIKIPGDYFLPIGQKFIGFKVKDVQPASDAMPFGKNNAEVTFAGGVTLSGNFVGASDFGGGITFKPDNKSAAKLPKFLGQDPNGIYLGNLLFTNQDLAKEIFKTKSKDLATIIIDEYTVVNVPADIFNTAHLVKLVK